MLAVCGWKSWGRQIRRQHRRDIEKRVCTVHYSSINSLQALTPTLTRELAQPDSHTGAPSPAVPDHRLLQTQIRLSRPPRPTPRSSSYLTPSTPPFPSLRRSSRSTASSTRRGARRAISLQYHLLKSAHHIRPQDLRRYHPRCCPRIHLRIGNSGRPVPCTQGRCSRCRRPQRCYCMCHPADQSQHTH